MLIISFDAVGDSEFERLTAYPAIASFARQAAIFRNVSTVFLSNTYPIHTSVATGVMPDVHGITSNTEPFPSPYPVWNSRETGIHARTIWQEAFESGIDTAAVFWPVTAFSKTIRYNIPEVLARPGKSQIITSLKAGSKLLQLSMFLRYRNMLNGIAQPGLDRFAVSCMADILRKYRPGLALIHLTAYDTLCHLHGQNSDGTAIAMEALDRSLALLLEAAGDEEDILIFSDHSQINVHTVIEPNKILVSLNLLTQEGGSCHPGKYGCFIECGGGSAFFHAGRLPFPQIDEVRKAIARSRGFRRFLTPEEMQVSGHKDIAFGFCAETGYCYEAAPSHEKATHGYPLDMPDYKVFYMVRGKNFTPGSISQGGSLLDIAPLVTASLKSLRRQK